MPPPGGRGVRPGARNPPLSHPSRPIQTRLGANAEVVLHPRPGPLHSSAAFAVGCDAGLTHSRANNFQDIKYKPDPSGGKGASMLRIHAHALTTNFKAEALTDTDLGAEAPSVFSRGPMAGLSNRYAFVPTGEIVQALREREWVPVSVEQQRVRNEARRGFQKHLIRFRRKEQMQTLEEWNPELVLTNSHDALCAYVLQVGIYRRICSNGLVVSDQSFEAIRFRHAGLEPEAVVQASFRILEFVPKLGGLIERFRNRMLTSAEALDFAGRALLLRYDTLEHSPIQPATLLEARRPEDQASDLWTTFSRVQENLIRGGLSDNKRDRRGRTRSIRSLRGIDSKVSLNKGLWTVAEEVSAARN